MEGVNQEILRYVEYLRRQTTIHIVIVLFVPSPEGLLIPVNVLSDTIAECKDRAGPKTAGQAGWLSRERGSILLCE